MHGALHPRTTRNAAGQAGRWSLFLTLLLILAPRPGSGQVVVGEVVEEGTGRPLRGAFVTLTDTAGARQMAVLTAADGSYMLRARSPGTYRITAHLIGYRSPTPERVVLGRDETVRRRIVVPVEALALEGITAQVDTRCEGRPDGDSRTERLWAEARKALEITRWGEERAFLFNLLEHRRELEARSLRVVSIEETARSARHASSPYRSVPSAALDSAGFVHAAGDDQWDHYAPDAEVLLSEWFLDTHCFRVAAEPGRVGLAFEPVRGRSQPEIRGTLWLDRVTAELRRLDFSYVGLPYRHGDWPQAGGTVEFERLPTGMWIVRRWAIRMPRSARWGRDDEGRRVLQLASLLERGAEVLSVRTEAGEVVARAVSATLYGTVRDSLTGAPLPGATLELPATGDRTRAGPDGTFRMSGLPKGRFEIRIHHPDLQLSGPGFASRVVALQPGRATRLVARPVVPQEGVDRCRESGRYADPIVLHGVVRQPETGLAAPSAIVRIGAPGGERRVVADSVGVFAVCLERQDSVAVLAVGPLGALRDRADFEPRVVRPTGSVTRADLTLHPDPAGPNGAIGAAAQAGLTAVVVRRGDDEPVAGAAVALRDSVGRTVHRGITDEHGRFSYRWPPADPDRLAILVEHLGYAPVRQTLQRSSGDHVVVKVALTERAIELEPIVVTERRRTLLTDIGFYERRDRTAGTFVDREEIERRRPSRLTDLFRGRAGISVVQSAEGLLSDIRMIRSSAMGGVGGDCQPAIWLDGVLVRNGGTPRGSRLRGAEPQLSELVSPAEVEGIEVYSGGAAVPPEYGGTGAACGVVLIWTRRGTR